MSLPQVKYVGSIREITIGKPGAELVIGGETAYSFYSFEGARPNAPRLALQVLDVEPEDWPEATLEPYRDVLKDPVAWAKKCVEEYKADAVTLWLAGTDPNGQNLSAEHAADVAKRVAEAVNVPVIVWGVSSDDKNVETLKAVAEACEGLNLVIGPITENNYKQIGAAAIAYRHVVAANSPIDINLAKQLNILLENLGVPNDKILVDPTTGGVGYGMEYCYSIMERIRQAALTQNDDKLQYPIINNIAEEVWKTKEAKLPESEEPNLGNQSIRGVNLEAITAISTLQAGSDLLILRHPETLKHVRKYLSSLMQATDLESMEVDMSLAGEAAPAKAAPAKPAPKPAAAAPAPKAEPAKPAPKAEAPKPEPVPEPEEKEEAAPAPPAAAPATAPPAAAARSATAEGDVDLSEVEFSDEEVETLREMLGIFRGVRNFVQFFGGLSQVLGQQQK
jgi:CO dehydrogenase/acetyl-CoA synthase delta subunit